MKNKPSNLNSLRFSLFSLINVPSIFASVVKTKRRKTRMVNLRIKFKKRFHNCYYYYYIINFNNFE